MACAGVRRTTRCAAQIGSTTDSPQYERPHVPPFRGAIRVRVCTSVMAGWDDDDFEVPDFTTTSDAPPARDALTAAGLLPRLSPTPSNESDDWFGPRAPSVLPEDTAARCARASRRRRRSSRSTRRPNGRSRAASCTRPLEGTQSKLCSRCAPGGPAKAAPPDADDRPLILVDFTARGDGASTPATSTRWRPTPSASSRTRSGGVRPIQRRRGAHRARVHADARAPTRRGGGARLSRDGRQLDQALRRRIPQLERPPLSPRQIDEAPLSSRAHPVIALDQPWSGGEIARSTARKMKP